MDAFKRFLIYTAYSYASLSLISEYIVSSPLTVGPSMLPTVGLLHDIAIVDKFSWRFKKRKVEIGDLVAIISPEDPSIQAMKRVVAMEFDRVARNAFEGDYTLVEIPKGHIWVEGDNQANSNDSRNYGPVSIGLVKGFVIAVGSWNRGFPWFHSLDKKLLSNIETSPEEKQIVIDYELD